MEERRRLVIFVDLLAGPVVFWDPNPNQNEIGVEVAELRRRWLRTLFNNVMRRRVEVFPDVEPNAFVFSEEDGNYETNFNFRYNQYLQRRRRRRRLRNRRNRRNRNRNNNNNNNDNSDYESENDIQNILYYF